jgi:hypothetical protein
MGLRCWLFGHKPAKRIPRESELVPPPPPINTDGTSPNLIFVDEADRVPLLVNADGNVICEIRNQASLHLQDEDLRLESGSVWCERCNQVVFPIEKMDNHPKKKPIPSYKDPEGILKQYISNQEGFLMTWLRIAKCSPFEKKLIRDLIDRELKGL